MNKKILIASWLFINFTFATVPASIDHPDMGMGQSFTLTIDVSNTNSDPDLNVLNNNFNILGTNNISKTNITNGHMNTQKSYIVSLSPKNSGKQIIPAIKVGNDATAPIAINVTQQSASEQALEKSELFAEARINNQSTYIGVPSILTLKFYYSINISNVSISNIDIKDATLQQLDKGTQYSENIKGVNYQVYEQKLQITPNKAGNISIPQINISGISGDNTGSFFSQLQPKPFNVATKTLNVTVKPIPAGMNLNEWFPAKKVTVNENQSGTNTNIKLGQPITRTITVEALGVPSSSIPEIKLPIPKNVNAYPDKTISNNSYTGNELLSTKVFKIAYIPTQAGEIVFPETSIKWWDITSNSLKTAVIAGKTYTVLNENGTAFNASAVAAQTPKPQSSIVRPAQNTVSTRSSNIWFYLTILFAILWLITILLVIVIWRKKTTVKTDNIAVDNRLASEKKALALIHSACHDKDINTLNTALVQWASIHWQKKVYTVLDIKDLSTNNILNELIDKLNQTLYRGTNFDKFDALAHEIDVLANSKQPKNNGGLKELYPK